MDDVVARMGEPLRVFILTCEDNEGDGGLRQHILQDIADGEPCPGTYLIGLYPEPVLVR